MYGVLKTYNFIIDIGLLYVRPSWRIKSEKVVHLSTVRRCIPTPTVVRNYQERWAIIYCCNITQNSLHTGKISLHMYLVLVKYKRVERLWEIVNNIYFSKASISKYSPRMVTEELALNGPFCVWCRRDWTFPSICSTISSHCTENLLQT